MTFPEKPAFSAGSPGKKSDKNYYESRLWQETMLAVAAEIRGDEDDRNILLYDEGAGISGTKGYDERPKLSKLYMDIANDLLEAW